MSDSADAGSATKDQDQDVVSGYLEQAYTRLLVPETDGSFRGEMLEFPGCIATGKTSVEALSGLENAARDWLEAAITQRQNIPLPVESGGFSGKLALRIPKSLHKKAARVAEREGVSLNQFIAYALAEHLGERRKTITQNIIGVTFNTMNVSFPVKSSNNIGDLLSKQMMISQFVSLESGHG